MEEKSVNNVSPVAIVTGGAKGIGQAISLVLAKNGTNVVVSDVDELAAEQTAEIVRGYGCRSIVLKTDVISEKEIIGLVSGTVKEFGRLDVLVNNAGVIKMSPILDLTVDQWDQTLNINLRGTFLASREAFRVMKLQKSGKIINISSLSAKIGGHAAPADYSASKAGIMTLTKSFALAGAEFGINVNAVAPGPIDTDLTRAWGSEVNNEFAEKIPLKRYGKPQDVAEAVAFLASEKSDYITGEIIDVNGGFLMD